MSMELRQRLEDIQKDLSLVDKPLDKGSRQEEESTPDVSQFEMNVMEPPPLHSRAGLFVYLNAAVSCSYGNSVTQTLTQGAAWWYS